MRRGGGAEFREAGDSAGGEQAWNKRQESSGKGMGGGWGGMEGKSVPRRQSFFSPPSLAARHTQAAAGGPRRRRRGHPLAVRQRVRLGTVRPRFARDPVSHATCPVGLSATPQPSHREGAHPGRAARRAAFLIGAARPKKHAKSGEFGCPGAKGKAN